MNAGRLLMWVLRAAGAALLIASAQALAGDFFEADGAAIRGYDPVAYFTAGKATKGSSAHTAAHGGSTFHFASQSNRDAFVANPSRYAPQYNGFCAFGVAGGYKAAIDPAAFTIADGKLYLNYSQGIRSKWTSDIRGYVSKGERNWPEVSRQTKVIQ